MILETLSHSTLPFCLGCGVGLVLALTGAGGSIIAVPLLMFGMGWTLTQAGPVALLAVASSAAVGAVIGLRAGIVRYRAAALMAAVGMAVTPAGLFVAHRVPLTPLTLMFAGLLVWISWRTFTQARASLRKADCDLHGQSTAPCLLDPQTGRLHWTGECARALALSGLGAGFLSGLMGVGGGFMIVPTLRRVTDLSMNAIVATSMMVIALVSSAAAISAAMTGHLPGAVAIPFVGGAVSAMFVGRVIAGRLAGPRLQQGFAVLTAFVALGLIVRTALA